jgi:hypothetical protein
MTKSRIYPHHQNKDGSYESICLTCFLTISHANTETELKLQEEAHLCAPSLVSKRADYKREHLNFGVMHNV